MNFMMYRLLTLLSLGVFSAGLAHPSHGPNATFNIPFEPHDGPTAYDVISKAGTLDWPKLWPAPNATTFDWWYFDAISEANETIVIVAHTFGNDTLEVPDFGGTTVTYIGGVFANGTAFDVFVPAPDGVTIKTSPRGISGEWKGAGLMFEGSTLDRPDTTYRVTFDSPAAGVSGTLTLRSVSPPHYPCDLNIAGANQEIIPQLFWSNALPDADATVSFTIGGEAVSFTGVGYHDKNWGTTAVRKLVRSWYWGHGRLGPYSLVWFDTLDQSGKEHYSSWITKNGKIISQSCEEKAVVVRPWGENTEYPPPPGAAPPSGYALRYDLGEMGIFLANFTREVNSQSMEIYGRFGGAFSGGLEGGEQFEGRAVAEQFQYPRLL